MSATTQAPPAAIEYPDSDGQPIAENTLQFEWIVMLKGNLDLLFRERADVFVAGDHLIYPVEDDNTIRQVPGVYVACGRRGTGAAIVSGPRAACSRKWCSRCCRRAIGPAR